MALNTNAEAVERTELEKRLYRVDGHPGIGATQGEEAVDAGNKHHALDRVRPQIGNRRHHQRAGVSQEQKYSAPDAIRHEPREQIGDNRATGIEEGGARPPNHWIGVSLGSGQALREHGSQLEIAHQPTIVASDIRNASTTRMRLSRSRKISARLNGRRDIFVTMSLACSVAAQRCSRTAFCQRSDSSMARRM